MTDDLKISKLKEDYMFYKSFPEDFNPKSMSWDELYSRLVIAYEGYEVICKEFEK